MLKSEGSEVEGKRFAQMPGGKNKETLPRTKNGSNILATRFKDVFARIFLIYEKTKFVLKASIQALLCITNKPIYNHLFLFRQHIDIVPPYIMAHIYGDPEKYIMRT